MSGVYETPLKDENGETVYYIGMTKRKFIDRLKELMADIKYGRINTTLARLHSTYGIEIDLSNAIINLHCNNFYKVTIIKTIENTNCMKYVIACSRLTFRNFGCIW